MFQEIGQVRKVWRKPRWHPMEAILGSHEELIAQARRHAQETRRSLRAVVEVELRRVLATRSQRNRYELPDLRVGDPNAPDPLATRSWPELRELTYGASDGWQSWVP